MFYRLKIQAVALLALSLSACSQIGSVFNGDESISTSAQSASSSDAGEGEAPLDLTISQAFIDKGLLNVKVVLEPKANLDPRQIAVSLIGLKEGEIVGEVTKRASDVYAGPVLETGERLAMRFEVDAADLSEYQVKCSWGGEEKNARALSESSGSSQAVTSEEEIVTPLTTASEPQVIDAETLIASSSPETDISESEALNEPREDSETLSKAEQTETRTALKASSQPLPFNSSSPGHATLKGLRTVTGRLACDNPPCDVLYTVVGELVNEGGTDVGDIELSIGLYWANDGQNAKFPTIADPRGENEELIALEGFKLKPGESKRIRINVDRSVPIVPGGRFVPYLRLLGFKADA